MCVCVRFVAGVCEVCGVGVCERSGVCVCVCVRFVVGVCEVCGVSVLQRGGWRLAAGRGLSGTTFIPAHIRFNNSSWTDTGP